MIQELSAAKTLEHLPALAEVYRAAFTAPPYDENEEDVARFEDEQLPRHAQRDGFRCVAARTDDNIVGFAYGYTGHPGQWWTDYVAERIRPALAQEWLGGHFEFVELAVHPDAQGRGIGGALHDALLKGLPHDRALLSTWRDDRPARRLYLNRGWRILQDDLDESSSLLGIDLRILRPWTNS